MPEKAPNIKCIFGRKAGCCGKKFECRLYGDVVRVVGPNVCNAHCPDRREKIAVSAILTAYNEGEQVRETIESFQEHAGPSVDLEIVVVDDGSSDGSCADLGSGVKVVRHEKSQGVGLSRNAGIEAAGGDVLCWFDAHMRAEPDAFRTLGVKALTDEAIVSAGSKGLTWKKPVWWGCDLFFNHKDGFQPKWRVRAPEGEWGQVPCMMGAAYFASRDTIKAMSVTGQFWEDIAGRWGFSEQALAVKAYIMGIPVLVHRRASFGHKYRSSNPVTTAGHDSWMNVARATRTLFGAEEFDRRWRPLCEQRLKGDLETAIEGIGEPPWEFDYDTIYTHLCGRAVAFEQRHPDYAWLDDLDNLCDQVLPKHPEGKGLTIWQWRPGESTLRLKRRLPKAEIHTCEYLGHRSGIWHKIMLANGIQSYTPPLNEEYVLAPLKIRDEYDIILIGGEKQERCLQIAEKALAPNGHILVDECAGRELIEQAERKKERKMLDEQGNVPAPELNASGPGLRLPPPPPAGPPLTPQPTIRSGAPSLTPVLGTNVPRVGSQPLVTVLLTNWQRPSNLPRILAALEKQTVSWQMFMWDNSGSGGSLIDSVQQHPKMKLYVRSQPNKRCWPRWLLASMADTEYVCTLDDDLCFQDERVLEDAIKASKKGCPKGVVGFFGWTGIGGQPYKASKQHTNGSHKDRRVDFIKGRFMFLRRESLERVPLSHPVLPDVKDLIERADDFYVNICISGGKRGYHLVPGILGKRWVDLPQHKSALAGQPGHYAKRGELIEKMFAHYEGQE